MVTVAALGGLVSASPRALWYVGRASGIMLLVLLTLSVVLGIVVRADGSVGRAPKFVLSALHRNLALVTVALAAVHIVTLEFDPFVTIGWLGAFVPALSPYRPMWMALGAVSGDVVVAVVVTSLVRARLGYRAWKFVHTLVYLAWPAAALHSMGTGTDTRVPWVFGLQLACVAAVVVAVASRLVRVPLSRPLPRAAAVSSLALAPIGLVAWAMTGPFQPGWARRAGTPTTLLANGAAGATGQGFAGSFAGSISQRSADDGRLVVDIGGLVSGGRSGSLKVVLRGGPAAGGGVVLTSSKATFASPTGIWTGSVTGLQGGDLTMILGGSGGNLLMKLALSEQGTRLSGQVSATPTASAAPAPRRSFGGESDEGGESSA